MVIDHTMCECMGILARRTRSKGINLLKDIEVKILYRVDFRLSSGLLGFAFSRFYILTVVSLAGH